MRRRWIDSDLGQWMQQAKYILQAGADPGFGRPHKFPAKQGVAWACADLLPLAVLEHGYPKMLT